MSEKKPLHSDISDKLRQFVKGLSPGTRLDPEAVLAKRFGVSIVTLRNAMLLLVNEGLVDRRNGVGCFVRDRSGSRHVAVLIERDISIPGMTYYHLHILQKVREYLEKAQVPVKLYVGRLRPTDAVPDEPTCREFIEDVDADRISGVVAVATKPKPRWSVPLAARSVPVVGIDRRDYQLCVDDDVPALVMEGIEILRRNGRRRIAVIGCNNPEVFKGIFPEGGQYPEQPVLDLSMAPMRPGADYENFMSLWSRLEPRPDGLLVISDIVYQNILPALFKLGVRVPDELLLVSTANRGSMVNYLLPTIKAEFDPDAIAEQMGALLLAAMRLPGLKNCEVRIEHRWLLSESFAGAGDHKILASLQDFSLKNEQPR